MTDEDLLADGQPEFTQIDCELSFVSQADVLHMFESFMQYLFRYVSNVVLGPFMQMTCTEAMQWYGTDKPDLRFGMLLVELVQ